MFVPRDFRSFGAACMTQDCIREERFSWKSGTVLLRTVRTQGSGSETVRPDVSIGIVTSAEVNSHISWHIDGRSALDKRWNATSKSDLVFVPSGCTIRDYFSGVGQGLWLYLNPAMLEQDRQVNDFLLRPTVDDSWDKDQLARAIVSALRKECIEGFPRGPLFLESAAAVFISRLAYLLGENDRPPFSSVRALDDPKLNRVIDYFDSNLHRNVSLSELSTLVNLTPGHFCAAFKQATGQRPHQFQIERRVERAKVLLRDSESSIADIALAAGFSSQSHMHIHFNRITGLTPARYRRDLHD